MSKRKTNKQILTALIKDLDNTPYGIGNALLRERLLKIAEITLQDIENNPKEWNNGFVQSGLFIDLCNRINKHCGFADQEDKLTIITP